MAECFDVNNAIRINARLEPIPLAQMPLLEHEEDEIPYDTRLLRICMPYGVASLLVIDDDKSKATVFSEQYESYKAKYSTATAEMITDVYADSEV